MGAGLLDFGSAGLSTAFLIHRMRWELLPFKIWGPELFSNDGDVYRAHWGRDRCNNSGMCEWGFLHSRRRRSLLHYRDGGRIKSRHCEGAMGRCSIS